jgi:hypothetical protein
MPNSLSTPTTLRSVGSAGFGHLRPLRLDEPYEQPVRGQQFGNRVGVCARSVRATNDYGA